MEELSKRERKELAKENRAHELSQAENKAKFKKYGIWFLAIGVCVGLVLWVYKYLTAPLPGQLFPDLGQEHVNDISDAEYNSNPPTSGKHFPVWAKKGVYDRTVSDGYLIHSLEHGYIVISYDCTKKVSQVQWMPNVLAQETVDEPVDAPVSTESGKPLTKMTVFPTDTKSWITPDSQPGLEVELPNEFNSEACKALIDDLSQFSSKWDRVVIVPRPNMDHPIALTAWRRLLTLDSLNKDTVEDFIKHFHNMGPEKTME